MKWFFLLALPLFVLDQVTKEAIVRNFPPPDSFPLEKTIIDGFFSLHRVHNEGVAFGMFNGTAYANIVFTFIATAALVFIIVMWRKGTFPDALSKTAATLLVSGILGNLTDRLYRGYVVDFLRFDLGFMVWPSFNVADACICVAATFLFISSFKTPPTPAAATEHDL